MYNIRNRLVLLLHLW